MGKVLKCIVLDDELPGLTYLKMLCQQIEGVEVVKAYSDPLIFLNEVQYLEFDFCISDIEMPGINGLELGKLLPNCPIIFTTAYKQYAVDAFGMDAIDYITKPIQKERLIQGVKKLRKYLNTNTPKRNYIQIQTDRGKTSILFSQLNYIRNSDIDSRDKLAHLEDGSTLILKNVSFEKLLEQLPENQFSRINKKEVLALRIVKYFTAHEITTLLLDEDGRALSFSLTDTYRKRFLNKMPGEQIT
ncbi:LytR/AlgR family response regulator transcription factor [Sphingobacterium lumbrici]|uniref:LytR/AlgR family response regulator transcription factor n=1 Tax=Sphingobacterium lumbrici TaxID=2559600 RepID=UPI00112CCC4F|nr:response regulator [Sphingobacterium lumbrici]